MEGYRTGDYDEGTYDRVDLLGGEGVDVDVDVEVDVDVDVGVGVDAGDGNEMQDAQGDEVHQHQVDQHQQQEDVDAMGVGMGLEDEESGVEAYPEGDAQGYEETYAEHDGNDGLEGDDAGVGTLGDDGTGIEQQDQDQDQDQHQQQHQEEVLDEQEIEGLDPHLMEHGHT